MITAIEYLYSGLGGLSRVGVQLLPVLGSLGHDLRLFSHDRPRDIAPLLPTSTPAVGWTQLPRLRPYRVFLPRPWLNAFAVNTLHLGRPRRQLRQAVDAAGLVVVNGPEAAWTAARAGVDASANPNNLLIVHESPGFTATDPAAQTARRLAIMKSYRTLCFVSTRVMDDWRRTAEFGDARLLAIPNSARDDAIDATRLNDRAAVRSRHGYRDDEVTVVCVASVQQRKGQDLLVRQFAAALAQHPGLRLLLFGAVASPFARALVAEVAATPAAPRIEFRGHDPDALSHVYAADMVVLASRAEAMPLSVLEAMALGRPVVASDVDGIPELVAHGETGLLFSHRDPDELGRHMTALAGDPARRDALGRAGRARYEANFSERVFRARYDALFRELLASGPC